MGYYQAVCKTIDHSHAPAHDVKYSFSNAAVSYHVFWEIMLIVKSRFFMIIKMLGRGSDFKQAQFISRNV